MCNNVRFLINIMFL